MVLQLPDTEGDFGVTFNAMSKDAVFCTSTSRFVARLGILPQDHRVMWLPQDDLQDSSWSSLVLLRDIHGGHLLR
jgi:hypothetical protein